MKTNICRFKGDSEILYEMTECLRDRKLDQKFIYLGNGGNRYYEYDKGFWGEKSDDIVTTDDWKKLIKRNINFELNTNIFNFISIACGDSSKEKVLLESLGIENMNYVGIDFSEEMINLSLENLKNVKFPSYLIRSDIIDIDFKRYLDSLVKRKEKRFFSFLGNTFGNIKTTNIVDLLGSYLKKGDIVGIDITVKKGNSIKNSIDLFNHYKEKTLNNKLWRSYILSAFNYVNFPTEKCKINIETTEDKTTGLYKIIFFLELEENLEFELEGKIIFSKGEKIQFYELYYYEPNKLIEFMKIHHFKCIDNNIKTFRGQFIFEKE